MVNSVICIAKVNINKINKRVSYSNLTFLYVTFYMPFFYINIFGNYNNANKCENMKNKL